MGRTHIGILRRHKVESHEAVGENLAASPVTFPQETPMASNAEQTVHQIQHDCQNLLKRVAPMRRVLRFGIVLQLGMLLGLLSFVRSMPAEPKVYTIDPARSELVV